jgi:branched-chain amino acid transport system substrate-binding protein
MRCRGARCRTYVGLLVAVALLVVGCGGSSGNKVENRSTPDSPATTPTPGVTATTVTFATHQPLTGPIASGYSEIATASQAFFNYVNAHGGVFGRQIKLVIKDDSYNPTNTVNVIHQLVLQGNVFGIYEGLGAPTHTTVAGYLNASKVPDLFVASGCACWDDGTKQPYTFGWQPSYTIEGKILGQYIKRHFRGKKVGVLYQDDGFGRGGLAGIEAEVPASDIVARQSYKPGATTLSTQVTSIADSKADVMVDFTVPVYTAIAQIAASKIGYKPRLVVSSAGSDPATVGGLLKTLSNGDPSQAALIEGAITDGFLPSAADTSNPWVRLFMKIRSQYDASAPWDSNVEYGMASAYTLVQALEAAGKNLTRQTLIDAINQHGASWTGPGLVPFGYSASSHGGYGGAEIGQIVNGDIILSGGPLTTTPEPGSPVTPYSGVQPAPPASGIPSG